MHVRVLSYSSASRRHFPAWRRLPYDARGKRLWDTSLFNSRDKLLAELFPDLNEEYNDWHLVSIDPCKPFGSSGKTRT